MGARRSACVGAEALAAEEPAQAGVVAAGFQARLESPAYERREHMRGFDDPFSPRGPLGGQGNTSERGLGGNSGSLGGAGNDGSVWDPSQARQGYTGYMPALSDLALSRLSPGVTDAA
ncbi:MAG TPA: hypothetical protein VKQ36_17425, partial [Ktedonobacterales bacterium]|nr:hypothetical protein [Ktedonobacterales bacterium]